MKCNQPRPGFELVSPFPFPSIITITHVHVHISLYMYVYAPISYIHKVCITYPMKIILYKIKNIFIKFNIFILFVSKSIFGTLRRWKEHIELVGWCICFWKSVQLICKINHHHDVVLLARISLTLSRHFSLSFIASGRSSGIHPISSHSCCMYVRAGHPAFAWPYEYITYELVLASPACLVYLAWIVFMMGGRWPCSWCLVECCRQDLFNIARNILV